MWYDKKVVSFYQLFLNFEDSIIGNVMSKAIDIPAMISDYDKNMGGVDRFDQQLHTYYNERKSRKWTNKLAIYY
jgi:hypothetical protein